MSRAVLLPLLAAGLLGAGSFRAGPAGGDAGASVSSQPLAVRAIADTLPDARADTPFYGIRLTRPGQPFGRALAYAAVAFPETPFNVAVTERGVYVYDLRVSARALPARRGVVHILWLASPDLGHLEKVGVLAGEEPLRARVAFDNKFILFVTEEASAEVSQPTGRVVARGTSRSGRMESMFSHGN